MGDHPLNFYIMSWIGPAITAIGGLANSLLGSSANGNLNRENREWQASQNSIAYERQKELTQLSPLLQKQGLQLAGISSAAMNGYSGGTASVGSANNAPSSLPEYVPFDVNALLNAVSVESQKKVADSEAEKNLADAEKTRIESGRYDELTDASIAKMRSDVSVNESTIKKVAAEVPLLNTQQDFLNWQASQAMLDYQKSESTYQSDIDRIKATNKCSQREAELRYDRAKDIVEAELALLRAQTYNARASGQAQLSNSYTNRLQYNLDKSISTYTNEYYKEAAGKLHSESVSEETFRHDRLRLLDNDATLHGIQAQMMGLDVANYNLNNTVDNASKLLNSATGLLGGVTNVRNSNTNRMNANTNRMNANTNRMNAHTNQYNAETRRMQRYRGKR